MYGLQRIINTNIQCYCYYVIVFPLKHRYIITDTQRCFASLVNHGGTRARVVKIQKFSLIFFSLDFTINKWMSLLFGVCFPNHTALLFVLDPRYKLSFRLSLSFVLNLQCRPIIILLHCLLKPLFFHIYFILGLIAWAPVFFRGVSFYI